MVLKNSGTEEQASVNYKGSNESTLKSAKLRRKSTDHGYPFFPCNLAGVLFDGSTVSAQSLFPAPSGGSIAESSWDKKRPWRYWL